MRLRPLFRSRPDLARREQFDERRAWMMLYGGRRTIDLAVTRGGRTVPAVKGRP